MANLADILVSLTLDTKEFTDGLRKAGQQMNDFRNHVKQQTMNLSGDFNTNLGSMVSSLETLSTSTESSTNSVSESLKDVAKSAQKASSSSRTFARTLSTDFQDSYRVISTAAKEFTEFGNTGKRVSMQVREQFAYLPRHLQRYVERLQEAGKSTQAFGRLNEEYGKRHVESLKRTNDYLQQRTKQSTQMIQALRDQSIMPLSQQFLRLGERMESAAKRGSALNLAITQLGANASPKAIADRMKLIQKGVTRATSTMMLFGIATGLAVWGLVEMSNVVDGRLKPAFDELKSTWLDALTPFVKAFTTFVVWILEGATAIGTLMKKFAEAHPQLSQMFWGFLLLTMALTALLAPLAVCIGLAGGLSAGFALLWTTIAPFVLGFLAVAGVAVILAAAIVTVVAVIHNMWNASEKLRVAWDTLMKGLSSAIATVIEPIKKKWLELKDAFMELVHTFTGGEAHSMGEFWTWLGDKVAIVVGWITANLLPILQEGFQIASNIIVGAMDLIIIGLQWLADMWEKHGDTIVSTLTTIWGYVEIAFNAISTFIESKMPQIQAIISKAFNLIRTIVTFTMDHIYPKVKTAFDFIWGIIKKVMPLVMWIIKDTWGTIKSLITNALNIIENAIELFTNVLNGDWDAAWKNVKEILKSALALLWDWIKLTILGKVLKLFKGLGGKVKEALSDMKDKITKPFKDGADKARKAVEDLKSKVTSKMQEMKDGIASKLSGLKDKITKPFTDAWDKIKGIPGKIKDAFSKMKISFPKIKVPKLSIGKTSKTIAGKEFSVPTFKLNWNAKGNIFNGASILGGGQGVGEKGAEAVMPIQHKRYMRPFASAVASHIAKGQGSQSKQSAGGDKYEIHFNEPVIIREDADIQRIVDELERRKRISERAQGTFSFA